MALGYLLGAAFQQEDQNGRPRTGATIRVCKHGTTTPYITYRDFDSNQNPADVPLNSEGMAVIIADDANVYDVYCRDALGVERWSRLNVTVGGSGGGGGGAAYYAGDGIEISDANVISVDDTVALKSEIPAAQVNSDWNAVSGVAEILNKPTIPDPLPSMTGKAGKVLTVNSGATAAEWAAVSDELPTRPSSSYETWSLDYDTHSPSTPVLEWKKKDSRLLSLTQATVGLNSYSRIVLTQDMIDNHRAYVYLDKSAFPSHLASPGFPWWQVYLQGLRFYKDTADVTLANTTWDIPLQVSTAPLAYPYNEQSTAIITTLRFKWESTGNFTDYQGGLALNVDYLNSNTSAMFIQLELYGHTSKLAVGDVIYFEGSVRPMSNIM